MQKLYDAMVAIPMAILIMAQWDIGPMRMLLIGAALLGLMVAGAYLGGYIMDTERHRRRKRMERRRQNDKRKTAGPAPEAGIQRGRIQNR